jgi:hypothetical protein
VTIRIALAFSGIALLNACSGGGSAAPKDWHPVAGTTGAWTSGSGSQTQEYRYGAATFGGTLQDLASQVTIDALTGNRGAKLQSSNPFGPCPGAAGVATFRLADRKTLEAGFAVRNGQAVRVRYVRPAGAPADRNALQAMQYVLCVPPA